MAAITFNAAHQKVHIREQLKTVLAAFREMLDVFVSKGMLRNNLVTFFGASCSELWCSSIPHESHEETC